MSGVTELIRDALETWAATLAGTLALSATATVSAHPPAAGTKPDLPTLACWFSEVVTENLGREVLAVDGSGNTIDYWGDAEADLQFIWRLGSEADANIVRDGWLEAALYDAVGSARSFESVAVPLEITAGASARRAHLYLTGRRTLATPDQTGQRDLWVVTHSARLAYPHISVSPSAVNSLAISVTVLGGTYHLSSGSDPIQSTPDL